MKTVEVRFYASLRKYQPNLAPGEASAITLEDKAELKDLVSAFKIPKKELAVILVNGRREEENYLLQDGDRIGIFPLIGGG